eukprot:2098523-Amphidinium_carterae.4
MQHPARNGSTHLSLDRVSRLFLIVCTYSFPTGPCPNDYPFTGIVVLRINAKKGSLSDLSSGPHG